MKSLYKEICEEIHKALNETRDVTLGRVVVIYYMGILVGVISCIIYFSISL